MDVLTNKPLALCRSLEAPPPPPPAPAPAPPPTTSVPLPSVGYSSGEEEEEDDGVSLGDEEGDGRANLMEAIRKAGELLISQQEKDSERDVGMVQCCVSYCRWCI